MWWRLLLLFGRMVMVELTRQRLRAAVVLVVALLMRIGTIAVVVQRLRQRLLLLLLVQRMILDGGSWSGCGRCRGCGPIGALAVPAERVLGGLWLRLMRGVLTQ